MYRDLIHWSIYRQKSRPTNPTIHYFLLPSAPQEDLLLKGGEEEGNTILVPLRKCSKTRDAYVDRKRFIGIDPCMDFTMILTTSVPGTIFFYFFSTTKKKKKLI